MTRADLEIVNDEIGQWNDTARERMQSHWEGSGRHGEGSAGRLSRCIHRMVMIDVR